MKIHKLIHCCLVIDLKPTDGHSRRILLDPGFYSLEKHSKVHKIDVVLITHEHADHFHIESLKELIKIHPEVTVITNDAVGAILAKEGIEHRVMEHGNAVDIKGIHIEACGKEHAVLHKSIPVFSNVGFLLTETAQVYPSKGRPAPVFIFPGDAFTDPLKEIDILALPVAGPWMKISEAIDYALQLKPEKAFPVHDALRVPSQHLLPEKILGLHGIEFIKLEEGGEIVYS
ncbi:MAG: MBL fold metallo-hydrolase [Candidatus Pacebacteria bacterium]|nr:MBL fold metallo-hydrolase [Candidatus Paceibacterota bacterium]